MIYYSTLVSDQTGNTMHAKRRRYMCYSVFVSRSFRVAFDFLLRCAVCGVRCWISMDKGGVECDLAYNMQTVYDNTRAHTRSKMFTIVSMETMEKSARQKLLQLKHFNFFWWYVNHSIGDTWITWLRMSYM